MQLGFGAGVMSATPINSVGGSPIRFGIMQDVSVDWDGEVKELYGQSEYALDARRAKTKISGKAKLAQISGLFMANLFFGVTAATGQQVPVYNEADSIGSSIKGTAASAAGTASLTVTLTAAVTGIAVGAPVLDSTTGTAVTTGTYVASVTGSVVTLSQHPAGTGIAINDVLSFGSTLTVLNGANFTTDTGVFYSSTGTQLVYVTAAPLQGQYTVNSGGIYVFSAADAGTAVLVNYSYSSSLTGYTITGGNPLMGQTPKFSINLSQQVDTNTLNLILYSCVAQKFMYPTKLDDYVIMEMDFMAFANSAGQTFQISTSQ